MAEWTDVCQALGAFVGGRPTESPFRRWIALLFLPVGAGWLATWLKVVAAILLLGRLGVICLRVMRLLPYLKRPVGQVSLSIACVSVFCAALPALVYVIGELVGREWISIPTMAVTHGVLNGLGCSLCGLLGWRILEIELKLSQHEG